METAPPCVRRSIPCSSRSCKSRRTVAMETFSNEQRESMETEPVRCNSRRIGSVRGLGFGFIRVSASWLVQPAQIQRFFLAAGIDFDYRFGGHGRGHRSGAGRIARRPPDQVELELHGAVAIPRKIGVP